MKYPLLTTAISGAALLGALPSAAQAKDWSLVPNIGFQYRNLSFDSQQTVNNVGLDGSQRKEKGDLNVNLPMASLGLTFIYNRFYASLKYEDSFKITTDSDVPFTGPLGGGEVDTAVTRTDWSFTVGGTVAMKSSPKNTANTVSDTMSKPLNGSHISEMPRSP